MSESQIGVEDIEVRINSRILRTSENGEYNAGRAFDSETSAVVWIRDLEGYIFSPERITVDFLDEDIVDVNFTATCAEHYEESDGECAPSIVPFGGVVELKLKNGENIPLLVFK